jgi:FkbM family methyltransferase
MSRLREWIVRLADLRVRRSADDAFDVGGLLHIGAAQHMEFMVWLREVRKRARVVRLDGGTVLARSLGRYPIFLDASDVGFGTHLMMDGFWEPWIAKFLISRVKSGMVAVDVGANYGYYTLIMADLVGRGGMVHAFEPNPNVCLQLAKSISVNGFEGVVTLHQDAVLDVVDGARMLLVPSGEPKNGHIVSEASGAEGGRAFEVSVCSLDSRLLSGRRIDFIKVDAEGAEELIVKGMDGILNQHKPELLIEFNCGRGLDPVAMVSRLNEIYRCGPMHISHDGVIEGVTLEQVMSRRVGEDWMLFYSMAA